MERGINGICSQFCPAAPRGFRQFCGAGRGGAGQSLLFAGRGSLFFRGASTPDFHAIPYWWGAWLQQLENYLNVKSEQFLKMWNLNHLCSLCSFRSFQGWTMIRVHFQPSSDLFNQSSLAHSIRTYWKHDASTLEQKLKTSDTHVLSELKLRFHLLDPKDGYK